MRFEDERYVRHYTRDTVGWLLLSFEAQGLFALLMRKVDRAGLLVIGKHGKRAVAVAVGHPARWKVIAKALEELLDDGCVEIRGEVLLIPNFIEAQEAPQSDAQRQRESRARARDRARAQDLLGPRPPQLVLTEGVSRNVTEPSRGVTTCHPYPADPTEPSDPAHSSARAGGGPGEGEENSVGGMPAPGAEGSAPLSPAAGRWPRSEALRVKLSARFAVVGRNGTGLGPPSTAEAWDQLEQDIAAVGDDAAFAACVAYGVERGAGAGTRSISFWLAWFHDFASGKGRAPKNGAARSAVATPADHSKFTGGERAV